MQARSSAWRRMERGFTGVGVSPGCGVEAAQCRAVGSGGRGALGRALPHACSLVPGKWGAWVAAVPPAPVPLLGCLVSRGLQGLGHSQLCRSTK